MSNVIPLVVLTLFVALIYSSVGHGGASGYLALLSFFALPHEQMAISALCLNLLVAGMAFWSFFRASHFSWKLTWPFATASIPFAFIGGWLKVPSTVYFFLLGCILIFAAGRLLIELDSDRHQVKHVPPLLISLFVGGSIGILTPR